MSDTVSSDVINQHIIQEYEFGLEFIHENAKLGADGNPQLVLQDDRTAFSSPFGEYTVRDLSQTNYNPNHATSHSDLLVTFADGNSYEFKDTVTYSKTAGTFHIVTQSYINGVPAGVDSITTKF